MPVQHMGTRVYRNLDATMILEETVRGNGARIATEMRANICQKTDSSRTGARAQKIAGGQFRG